MWSVAVLATAMLGSISSEDSFCLRDGDRVVFHGDSITEQAYYTNFVESVVLSRYRERRIEFFNVGWSGDTTWGTTGWEGAGGSSEERVRRDIAPLKPTVVSTMFGMNDGGYVPYDPKVDELFRTWYAKVLRWIREDAPAVRFTVNLTSPWDDTTRPPSFPGDQKHEGGYNDVLLRYGETVRALAKEFGATFVDLNRPLVAAMALAKERDETVARQIVPDWIHPSPAGGALMAAEILKAWGVAPQASDVRLDASTRRVVKGTGTKVSGFDGSSWTQTDAVLPFPLDLEDKAMVLVAQCANLPEFFGRPMVAVENLPKGQYRLIVDETAIGVFSERDLALGVDLSFRATPMLAQSRELLRLTARKSRAFYVKWREVALGFPGQRHAKRAQDALEALRKDLCARQRAVAKPTSHRFRIVPA